MACHGARRLLQMTDNLFHILGIEAICGAQGIALRRPLTTSPALASVMARLREDVAELVEDRYMAPDLDAGARLVATGALAEASGIRLPGLG